MKKLIGVLPLAVAFSILLSCGSKPGGLKDFNEMVPEFTVRLNKALKSNTYTDLLDLFDADCAIVLNTEFNPEMYRGREGGRQYFSGMPEGTVFEIGEIELKGLRAETVYHYQQKNGASGSGTWEFKLNNMGKISEFTISPGDTGGE